MPSNELIRSKLSDLPHKPGVYLMKDRFGTVIYVGKARDLRRRVSQYFHPSRRSGWDLKLNALVEAIYDLDTHQVRSEAEALLLEGKLIKEFKPRYNISFRDDKRFLLLKINLNDPIPRFSLTRIKQEDEARYFGPFASSGAVRRTLALARRKFHLRGCRPLTPNADDYKHCLYGNLKFCTAPCIGNVTREAYLAQVTAACEFLAGQTNEMRDELMVEMKRAAAALNFEKAAQLRDMIEDLKRTTEKTNKFERIPYTLPVAIDPAHDLEELQKVLGLAVLPKWIEGFDISNISGTFAVASMVKFVGGKPDRNGYRRFKMKTVIGQNDFACMAEAVRRRYSRLSRQSENLEVTDDGAGQEGDEGGAASEVGEGVEESGRFPDLILIDGGKGQLGAALEELEALGLGRLRVIGLAKEFEEIYVPGESEPIRLSHDTGALKLLQRVRDESHRFANTYNAQLRLRRISESLLDEFPGIGERRKSDLLKRFGSVQRLKRASYEEIAEVPGFGGKLAMEFKSWLDARSES